MPLLSLKNYCVWYSDPVKYAVDHVSIDISGSGVTAIVGESGSGKSTLGYGIMGLLQFTPQAHQTGEIYYNNEPLPLTETDFSGLRGKHFGYIFQEPLLALNPVYSVGEQLTKVLKYHHINDYKNKSLEWLNRVGLDAKRVNNLYPHQLSGGMRQRVMIALAIATGPKVIIADEPTSGIDAVIRYDIMTMLTGLTKENKAMLLITHDIAVASHFSDHIHVMQNGIVVESGATRDVISAPKHDYTQLLVSRFNASMQQFDTGYKN